jgi:hypothetical protein
MRLALSLLVALCLSALSAPAHARGAHFLGPHPIAAKLGGGYCYIEAPHIHVYAPDHQNLYQRVNDDYVFTGDPTPFGYEGDQHKFYGNHPVVTVGGEPVFCYIDGPHYHAFAPPEVPDYRMEKGVAFYVGPVPPAIAKLRPQRRRLVNAEYRPYVAMRPVVEVAPPPEWQGEVWVAPPAVEIGAPGVVVGAPGVVVAPPSVAVSAPGVVVAAPSVAVSAPGVFVAPPRVHVAAPHVSVTAPGFAVSAPGVVVGAPGVVVGAPGVAVEGGVYVEGHGHHDNGRHGGWGDDDDQGHHDNGRHRGWGKHGR